MGNTQSPQTTQEKYSYFQSYQDPHFGSCNILRNNHNSNQFVMQICQNFPQQQVNMIQKNLKSFKTNYFLTFEDFPFLKIVDWNISSHQNNLGNKLVSTCKMPEVTICVEFLRHNLKDFLQWRKMQNRPLSLSEVTMALNKALKAYEMTKNNQLFGLSLDLEDISITIEGEMKFNPLLGKPLIKNLTSQKTGLRSCQVSPLRERIIARRDLKSQKQNINSKVITSKQYRYLSPYLSQDSEFLAQLKKFANQLIWDSTYSMMNAKNPEDLQYDERKQMKRFLNEFHCIKGIKQAKKFIGESSLKLFYVDFARLQHQQSQAKFTKILSQIQERSEKTDYSYHESLSYISPNKNSSSKSHQFITSQYYNYS